MLNRQHDKGTVPAEQSLVGQCWLLPCPSACLAHRTAAMAGRTGTRRAVRTLSGPFFGHSQIFAVYYYFLSKMMELEKVQVSFFFTIETFLQPKLGVETQ